MNSLSQLDRNKIIKEFYAKHKSNGKSFTVKHFTLMGLGKVNFIAYSLALKEAKNSVVKLEGEELLKKCQLPKEENL